MITFIGLMIDGFCSYEGQSYISLNEKQTVLVKASNGQGKSTIFSALVWGLYGKTIKGNSEVNTWKEIRSKDYNGTRVDVTFQKGDSTYVITRCQNYTLCLEDGAKGKDRLTVQKDVDFIDIKGKAKLQEYIVNEIGLSYKLFLNSIMFGQGIQRLIQESNSDKKKLFEEVFNLNFLNIAKDMAVKMRNEVKMQVNEIEHEYKSFNNEFENTRETYYDLKEREDSFKSDIKDKKRNLKANKTKLEEQLSKIGNPEQGIEEAEDKINKLKKNLTKVNTKLEKAKNLSDIPVIEVIDKVIVLLEKGNADKALSKMKIIKESFKAIDIYSDKKYSLKDKISKYERDRANLYRDKSNKKDLNRRIEDIEDQIKELKKEKLHVLSPKYKKRALEMKEKLKHIEAKLKKANKQLEDVEWLIEDPLSNKGIKAYLFNSSLDLLNRTLENYSKVLGFRISFDIDLGSTKKDFITLIERGDIIIDYDELSGGEKQLANVAMAFAMNESLTASKGINIAFLDEVFESLDHENIDLVVSLINNIYEDKTLFLITHQDSLPLSNCKTLQVKKQYGVSTVQVL